MGGYAAPGDFRPLMNKDITLHSFYEGRHEYDAKVPGILQEATAMIVAGTLHVPIAATYPLTAIKEAVAHAERGGGKVLLDPQKA
jgi:NADPH:quinone reductase-like Zn-dependent oxidoreductase